MSETPRFILDITHEEELRDAVALAASGGADAPVVVSHLVADATLWELDALRARIKELEAFR